MSDPDFSGNELASWLQEAGRRRVERKSEAAPAQACLAQASAPARAWHKLSSQVRHPRELMLIALAALAFLPYFFADVQVQISSLRCVIVFV